MNELISVIVPVYNVEKYLPRCVESIRNQTYRNLEIILVDDGSPDGCPALCDAYAAEDARIRVIHKPNGGQADARNEAIDIAKGDYLTFIDSDDYVTLNYVETLYLALKQNQADISVVGMAKFFEEERCQREEVAAACVCVYDQMEAIRQLLTMNSLSPEAWGKLYKRGLFDTIRFPAGEVYEDLAIIFHLLLGAECIVKVDSPLYRYLTREGSTMQSAFSMRQYVEVRWIEESMEAVALRYPELDHEIRGRKVWSYFKTLYRILCSKDRAKYCKQQDEMIRKIRVDSKGLLHSDRINRNLKIKIASLYFGRYGYYAVQKFSDALKQMKAGRRYTV